MICISIVKPFGKSRLIFYHITDKVFCEHFKIISDKFKAVVLVKADILLLLVCVKIVVSLHRTRLA